MSNKIFLHYLFILLILISILTNFYFHFESFLNYYNKPASYAEVNIQTSLNSIYIYFKEELGVGFFILLFSIFLFFNKFAYRKTNYFQYLNIYLIIPFLLLFIFLIFILNATNQPHVFTLLVVFLIPFCFIKVNFTVNNWIVYVFVIFTFLLSSYRYFSTIDKIVTDKIPVNSRLIAEKIDLLTNFSKKKKYFILFDTAQEIPLDVYFFKKYKIYNNNILKFYFTDWDYYDIDKKLNINNIVAFYKEQILSQKPKIIVLNQNKLKLGKDRRLAEKINQILIQFVKKSSYYKKVLVKKIDNKNLVFYKLI